MCMCQWTNEKKYIYKQKWTCLWEICYWLKCIITCVMRVVKGRSWFCSMHELSFCKRTTLNLSSCLQGFREILRFLLYEKKNFQFMYISEGKARLTLVHVTNHACLSVKFMWHIFGLNYAVCHKRPFKVSIWPAKIITWPPNETKKSMKIGQNWWLS